MNRKFFLLPTKVKASSTIIILIAILVSGYISDSITEMLVSPSLVNELLETNFEEFLTSNTDALANIGFQMMFISILVHVVVMYIAVCLVFKYQRENM